LNQKWLTISVGFTRSPFFLIWCLNFNTNLTYKWYFELCSNINLYTNVVFSIISRFRNLN
jgi:hypothetical protein